MADLQSPAETAPEPSMEEILASIRKIIADENNPSAAPAAKDDAVELTQMVEEDGSVTDLAAPPPAPEPVMAAPTPTPTPPVSTSNLMSDTKVEEAASALSSLANMAAIDRLSSVPQGSTYLGNSGRTLEDMVIELMRPLLKDWLDQNLPALVDRLVQNEVERISRRAKD